jgi:tripartite-type tricarboxylate transporter receptor subunit TctC
MNPGRGLSTVEEGISREANVMVVNPSAPSKTVSEFIAYAKARPGEINMASSGNGTLSHMAGELFRMKTGINLVHVPYRGDVLARRQCPNSVPKRESTTYT